MEDTFLKICFITALTLTGLLCGASLDQSIKQLPARHVIGLQAFSNYAKAADLKNGVIWYALLGVGAALASIITAIITWHGHENENYALPLYLGVFFAICHTICTTQAAPTYHKQKKINDAEELKKLFHKFETIQTFRSVFITLNVLSYLWALTILL
ncbi:MAG TPA: hypothetical protein VK809_09390 [Bacteroidia bacterium]|jgi:hypothetical protein|nr:hypothetical protein [Bacteroidia bacterium]